jgi:hypothetical protein
MATGREIQEWYYVEQKAKDNGMGVQILGDGFRLISNKESLGHFNTVDQMYQYLCGYEVGFSRVKIHDSSAKIIGKKRIRL